MDRGVVPNRLSGLAVETHLQVGRICYSTYPLASARFGPGSVEPRRQMDDPRCPECGGPIAAAASYCIHCAADLEGREPVPDGDTLETLADQGATDADSVSTASGQPVEHPIDPEGVMDNTLTVLVGVLGGFIIGMVGTILLLFLTESGLGILFGLAVWLGGTAYLVRRRYLMDAVSRTAYGIALVLLAVPVVALALEGDLASRGVRFSVLFLIVIVPSAIAAAFGWVASRYVPESASVG